MLVSWRFARSVLVGGVVCTLHLDAPSARAQAPQTDGDETRANAYTTGPQQTPAAGMASDGSFVVVWSSGSYDFGAATQDGSRAGIYGRRFAADGTPSGEFLVNTWTSHNQYDPQVAVRPTGEFVVVWTTTYQPDSCCGFDIRGQRYSAAGTAQGAEFAVNQSANLASQHESAIANDASGNFVVTWQSSEEGPGNNGIYARRFDAAGNALGNDFHVNTSTAFHQTFPDVAMDADGDFVIVWTDAILDASGDNVQAQRYNSSGVAQGGQFQVNTTTINSQNFPSVAMDSAGNFVVAFENQSASGDSSGTGISARRFNSSGVAQGGEFLVNTYTTGHQSAPSVSMEPDGAFLITWTSANQDGSGLGVYGQRYNAAGGALGGEFRLNTYTTSDQSAVAVAAADGKAIAAWQSLNQTGDADLGVFFQRYTLPDPNPPGSLQFSTSAYAVNEGAGTATITVTRTGGSGGAIAVSYATGNGSAQAGSDYTAASGTVNFADGDTADKTFAVTITNDTAVESSETINLTLGNPTGGATLGSPNTAVLTITDNDTPPGTLQFSASAYGATEADPPTVVNATITVTRAGGSGGAVSVNYATSNDTAEAGVDYTATSGTLNWADGDTTSKTFAVPILVNDAVELAETLNLTLSNPTGGATLGSPSTAVLTITDDDTPPGPPTGEFTINTYKTASQDTAAATADSTGYFIVVWESLGQEGGASRNNIYGQRLTNLGVHFDAEYRVNRNTTTASAFRPSISADGAGHFIVAWEAVQDSNNLSRDILAQRFDANWAYVGNEIRVTPLSAAVFDASVSMNATGEFVVVWQGNDASGPGIYGRLYESDGDPKTDVFPVNAVVTSTQQLPQVAMDASGAFVVVWEGFQDGLQDIYARRFDNTGVAMGNDFKVNTYTTDSQTNPWVGTDAVGNFVSVWRDPRGIFGRRFTASGTGSEEFPVKEKNTLSLPQMAMNPSGGFVVVWQEGSDGIGARYYQSDLTSSGPFLATLTTPVVTFDPAVALDAAGNMLPVWSKFIASGDLDVVGRRIASVEPPPGPAGQLQFTTAAADAPEAANKTVTVTRTSGSSGTVGVTYTVAAGSATAVGDFTPKTGTLTFLNGETSKTVTVEILDDTVDEPNETVVVTLSAPTGGVTIGAPATQTLTIVDDDEAVPPAKGPFYLAEGATGFFDLEFAVANPNPVPGPIRASFLKPDSSTVNLELALPAMSRSTIYVNQIPGLDNTALSTVVESQNGLPLMVERTMSWDRATGYGAHTEKAGEGARRQWFFAEGSQGFFDTWLLLANPRDEAITAEVRFLTEAIGTVTCTLVLAPTSRVNVFAGDLKPSGASCSAGRYALVGQSFGMTVTFSEPAAAERSMYFGTSAGRSWNGGHGSVGIAAPATSWYHAEGATGPFFDTYILVINPNPTDATVTYKYFLANGLVITKFALVAANSRHTVNVESQHPELANTAVSTQVTSNRPIVSERAMYWAGPASSWYEAHNSFGLTTLGTKWGIAEGRVGGPRGYETFILLANTNDAPVTVTVTYMLTDGVTHVETYDVDPTSRYNIHANKLWYLQGQQFSAVIEATAPIAVERAMYWNAGGVKWAAGTNATAARIP